MATLMGLRISYNSENYLGLPNMVGQRKRQPFQNIKDNIAQKIESWSSRVLSQGGKEIFIKSVLQAVPSYVMSCFLLSRVFCIDLEKIFACYWWRNSTRKKRVH